MADQLRPLSRVARAVLGDQCPSPATLWRWTSKGISGIRLPVTRVGRRAFSTESHFRQWLADVTAAQQCHPPDESTAERSADLRAKLSDAGLLDGSRAERQANENSTNRSQLGVPRGPP